jgi:hypothetical protein
MDWPQPSSSNDENDPLASQQADDNNNVNDLDSTLLVQAAKNRMDVNNNLVLIYASFSYKLPLMNWLVAMARLRNVRSHVLIVCLDDQLGEYLQNLGEQCISLNSLSKQGKRLDLSSVRRLWVIRAEHVLALLKAGVNVVVSDSDAIWLRDPFASGLFSNKSGDVVGGKGKFPYNQKWGTALCMGVVYFRATPAVIDLALKALEFTKETNDDQIGFNRGIGLVPGGGNALAFSNRLVGPTDDLPALFSSENGLRVRLVEHKFIPRECQLVRNWKQDVQIAHCHVNDGVAALTNKNKGNQQSHSAVLVKYDLFYLENTYWESRLVRLVAGNGVRFWSALEQMGGARKP